MILKRTSGDAVVNILDEYRPFVGTKYHVHVSTSYGTKKNRHTFYVGMEGWFKEYHFLLLYVTIASIDNLYPVTVAHHTLSKNNKFKKKKYICCNEQNYLETLETLLDSVSTKNVLNRIEAAYHATQETKTWARHHARLLGSPELTL